MNTVLDEPAVLEIMRQEHAKLTAQAAELWLRLKTTEIALKPYKDAHDDALRAWADVNRQADMFGAVLKAKEPAPVPQEA